jgi:O-succinylbenzoate synthase
MILTDRDGLIIRYQNNPLDVLSEIAPLQGFSRESTDEAIELVKDNLSEIHSHLMDPDSVSWNDWLITSSLPPSVRFGLDILMSKSMATRLGIPLEQFLHPSAQNRIGTNAVLGIMPPDDLEKRTSQLIADGYRTIKYKVGDPLPYLDAWLRIRKMFPDLKMRFDANGSWMQDQAEIWAKLLEPVSLEYLEQPLAVGHETEMATLQSQINYPIAFDESARDIESIKSILKISPKAVIILKPMLLGSIAELSSIIDTITSHKAAFTITTLIESGIGRNMVASIAAAFATDTVDHGLGTGSLFVEDILMDLDIEEGRFVIDPKPSSRINSTLLETFRIG